MARFPARRTGTWSRQPRASNHRGGTAETLSDSLSQVNMYKQGPSAFMFFEVKKLARRFARQKPEAFSAGR
jgi:hypothetical protein